VIARRHPALALLLALASCVVSAGAADQSATAPTDERELSISRPIDIHEGKWGFVLKEFERDKAGLSGAHVTIQDADLDGDGQPEIFVYVQAGRLCGTHACPVLAYQMKESGAKRLLSIAAWPSVFLLPSTTNGLRDLSFAPPGVGRHVLRFNGSVYE
jgi:hypothetical protein